MVCVLSSITGTVYAQSYPEKPIRAIVPFVAGGPTDIMARALGQKLSAAFGKQFIIDNRSGGGGVIAATMAKEAPADGYTIFSVPSARWPPTSRSAKNCPMIRSRITHLSR